MKKNSLGAVALAERTIGGGGQSPFTAKSVLVAKVLNKSVVILGC